MKKLIYKSLIVATMLGIAGSTGITGHTIQAAETNTHNSTKQDESIYSWMPNAHTQEATLKALIDDGTLPADAKVTDITKDLLAKEHSQGLIVVTGNDYIGVLTPSSLKGTEYYNGIISLAITSKGGYNDNAYQIVDNIDLTPIKLHEKRYPDTYLTVIGFLNEYNRLPSTRFINNLSLLQARGLPNGKNLFYRNAAGTQIDGYIPRVSGYIDARNEEYNGFYVPFSQFWNQSSEIYTGSELSAGTSSVKNKITGKSFDIFVSTVDDYGNVHIKIKDLLTEDEKLMVEDLKENPQNYDLLEIKFFYEINRMIAQNIIYYQFK